MKMKNNYAYVLLVIAILFTNTKPATAQVDVNDSLALVALYNSTDGPGWTHHDNWLTSAPVESWYGIVVSSSNSNNRVQKVSLYYNNLKGSIPSELGNLANLVSLDLSSNNLNGNIPKELGNLTILDYDKQI